MSTVPRSNVASISPNMLQAGLDYYIEDGRWVFTEHFLLKRGHCCGSGCRHCPYKKGRRLSHDAREDTHGKEAIT
jgi:hypothetical protein